MSNRLLPPVAGAALLVLVGAQAQEAAPAALERVLAAEQRQVDLIARLSPSVAAVFQGEEVGQGGGSGVIIDPRGYVLTNFHVAETNPELTVGLDDGKTYKARLLGIDPGGDLALLRLEGRQTFAAVPLGDSDALRPGEPVFAMGNPFLLAEDFTPTVTQGVVSGIHRYRDATGGSDLVYGDCVQIDASINPGNSGGPLFSARGRLLGINGLGGFRPDRGRVNVGVGFAASVAQIKNFLLDLRACRQCYHGTMNATVRDVDTPDGRRSRLLVDAISRESNAYAAGLRLGDQVRSLDGQEVTTQNQLLTLISRLPAGRRVTVGAEREREDGQGVHELELTFRLEPLWAGPMQGEWVPDAALLARETQEILAAHRATQPPQEWSREEIVTLPGGGGTERRVLRVKGRQIREEVGLEGAATVSVYDGSRGWKQAPGGAREKLSAAERDRLAGTVEALYALSAPEGQEGLANLEFTGGEVLADGRQAIRLEARDGAGRKRLLYLDPERYDLIGVAYPGQDGWAVEESWTVADDGALSLRRVDFGSAKVLAQASGSWRAGPQDAALFQGGE